MTQSLDLVVLSCLFFAAVCQTRLILPPRNVSLTWSTDFLPLLSWEPPEHSVENCTYEVKNRGKTETQVQPPATNYLSDTAMNGSSVVMSVETVCDGQRSTPVVKNIYPELVKDLDCYIHSSDRSHCSWFPASDATDLRFYYRLSNENGEVSADDDILPPLRECSSYNHTGEKPGCDLQATSNNDIYILFNGTLNNKTVKNTFMIELMNNVRPPALKWNVIKTKDTFNISWTPEILSLNLWQFNINYTECDVLKVQTVFDTTSFELPRVSHCPYCIHIQAVSRESFLKARTPWTDKKCFDAEPNAMVYAAIIIPLVFAGLAILAFVCCRKNKESIFPKVPEPRDLLSDISDNNNKSTVPNFYFPAMEEENCKITLVVDPQNNKPCL